MNKTETKYNLINKTPELNKNFKNYIKTLKEKSKK
jgi:hypothetical protein